MLFNFQVCMMVLSSTFTSLECGKTHRVFKCAGSCFVACIQFIVANISNAEEKNVYSVVSG